MKVIIEAFIPEHLSYGEISLAIKDHSVKDEIIDNLLIHICNKLNLNRIVIDNDSDGELNNKGEKVWRVGICRKE